MIKLSNSINNKAVYVAVNHIVAMYPGTTGTEILTTSGVIYRVHEELEDVISAMKDYATDMAEAVFGND